jgi:hypothetical protein
MVRLIAMQATAAPTLKATGRSRRASLFGSLLAASMVCIDHPDPEYE